MLYAEIAINRDLQTFTYEIPVQLQIEVGHLVRIPFRTAQEAGIVVRITDQKPEFATKKIVERLDPIPVLNPVQIDLAHWIAENTLSPLARCLWLMMPPGFTPKSDKKYMLIDPTADARSEMQQQILSLLKRRGALTGQQLRTAIGSLQWTNSMRTLIERGVVIADGTLTPPAVRPKFVRNAQLAIDPAELDEVMLRMGKESKRANVLEVLSLHGSLPLDDLAIEAGCTDATIKKMKDSLTIKDGIVSLDLSPAETRSAIIKARGGAPYIDVLQALLWAGGMLDVSEIYAQTGTELRHLKRLHEQGYLVLGESEVWRKTLADKTVIPDTPPDLTPQQAAAWHLIENDIEARARGDIPANSHGFLIHGVTGSGKTEIYIRAVEKTLATGRQAIVMVPEIALTTQTVKRFAKRFPEQVALIHSTLSVGERFDTWRRIRQGHIKVVIGARSALFVPMENVGLIILDEEHDHSYKQSPPIQPPYYHTREVAMEYMHHHHGTVILGSATPDVETYYRATQGELTLLEMPDRIPNGNGKGTPSPLPPVQIVDMRQELRMGNTSVFSRALQTALTETLESGHQAVLFLNRRGMATYVFCRDCGYIAKCEACDATLTYHEKSGQYEDKLVCHSCGHQQANPRQCPACQSNRIKYFGRGTEQVAKILNESFPEARVLRWDRDSASQKGKHEEIYETFLNRDADILVGTQMIAKGLDMPFVTLVGIISGDTALGLPHFRANEHTFQLLAQVSGRAGRGDAPGRAILQTYQPQNYAIQAAAAHDYQRFYEQDIAFRRREHWVPFKQLARILFRDALEANVREDSRATLRNLVKHVQALEMTDVSFLGPAPCFFHKRNDIYHWQIIVKAYDPVAIFRDFPLPDTALLDIHPLNLL